MPTTLTRCSPFWQDTLTNRCVSSATSFGEVATAMTPRAKAQQGVRLIQEAILELLGSSKVAMTHADIVNALQIHSDFEGTGKNYLSWSVLGLLVNGGQIHYDGDRQARRYFIREDQLS